MYIFVILIQLTCNGKYRIVAHHYLSLRYILVDIYCVQILYYLNKICFSKTTCIYKYKDMKVRFCKLFIKFKNKLNYFNYY